MLNEDEHRRITEALRDWADSVPDLPLFGFLDSERLLTPREIVDQVRENTPTGQAVLQMLEHGLRREGLDGVVTRLRRRAAR